MLTPRQEKGLILKKAVRGIRHHVTPVAMAPIMNISNEIQFPLVDSFGVFINLQVDKIVELTLAGQQVLFSICNVLLENNLADYRAYKTVTIPGRDSTEPRNVITSPIPD